MLLEGQFDAAFVVDVAAHAFLRKPLGDVGLVSPLAHGVEVGEDVGIARFALVECLSIVEIYFCQSEDGPGVAHGTTATLYVHLRIDEFLEVIACAGGVCLVFSVLSAVPSLDLTAFPKRVVEDEGGRHAFVSVEIGVCLGLAVVPVECASILHFVCVCQVLGWVHAALSAIADREVADFESRVGTITAHKDILIAPESILEEVAVAGMQRVLT